MKIAITGHRPNKLGHDYDLTSPLLHKIKCEILLKLGETVRNDKTHFKNCQFITGMALGIDTLFAKIAIELGIPFTAAIPFNGQHLKWPFKSRETYLYLLSKAAEVVNVSGDDKYKPEYMHKRNIWMVNECDKLISVWDGSTSGGTFKCTEYARDKKPIIHINPKML